MVVRTIPFKSRDKPKPDEPLPSISAEMRKQAEADQKDIKKQLKHAQQQLDLTNVLRCHEASLCAATRPMHRSKNRYSITSSAVASRVGGTVRPNALAVLRLITNSNLVGCSTGRSDGFAPLRILST